MTRRKATAGSMPGTAGLGALLALAVAACISRSPDPAIPDEPDLPKPFQPFRERCTEGDALACITLGERLFWVDTGLAVGTRLAVAVRACELGEPNGCGIAGLTHRFRTHDRERERHYLLRGCNEGSYLSCYALRQREPHAGRPNAQRVVELLEQGCERPDNPDCTAGGVLMVSGFAGASDSGRGLALLEEGCRRNREHCAVVAAYLRLNGHGTPERIEALCTHARSGEAADEDAACPGSFQRFVDGYSEPVRVP